VTDADVLIVGLGPVGAVLAALLADAGLRSIAVERDTDVYPLPRAAHFDHEIMRLFQQLGVADDILPHARPTPAYEFRSASGEVLISLPGSDRPASTGWANGYMFNQPAVEAALRAKLAQSPLADVRLGHTFETLRQESDHVSAVIRGPDGDATLNARYLVGCDGAWSPVREAIGGTLFDYQFDEPWLVIDVKVRGKGRTPTVNLQICDPARPTTCVLMGPGRHRWEFMLLPGETAETMLDDAVIRDLLAPWNCGDDIEIDRKAVYRFHGLVAQTWRNGRVLLAGDSAHQMPPFAGQGMCSGLRDAANLAWKLKAVLKDGAAETLLDTYQPEREPHVRGYIELAIGMGRVVCTLDPAVAAERDAGMLAARRSGVSPLPPAGAKPMQEGVILRGAPEAGAMFPQPWSTGRERKGLDDVLGQGAWLIVDGPAPPTPPWLIAASLAEPRLAPFRQALGAWLAKRNVPAVLVRPDRYVFGTGKAERLAEAYNEALCAPPCAPSVSPQEGGLPPPPR
jgi:3-(3-hydroxy-phenyl)propionate hydroxylase